MVMVMGPCALCGQEASTSCLCFRHTLASSLLTAGPALGPLGSDIRERRVRSWLRARTNILTCCCLPPWLACQLHVSGECPALPGQPDDPPASAPPAPDSLPGSQKQRAPRLPVGCVRPRWAPWGLPSQTLSSGCAPAGTAQRTARAFLGPPSWRATSALCMVSGALI